MNNLETWAVLGSDVAWRVTLFLSLASLAVGSVLWLLPRTTPQSQFRLWNVVLLLGLLWFQVPIPAVWLTQAGLLRERATTAAISTPSTDPSRTAQLATLSKESAADYRTLWQSNVHAPTESASRLSHHGVWLAAIWSAGVVGYLTLLALRIARFRRAVLLVGRPASAQLQQACDAEATRWGIRRPLPVLISAGCQTPCLVGWLRPTIVLPASVLELPPDQCQALLAHELAHLARGDQWWALAALAAGVLNFFNPIVWWTRKCAYRACERSVDRDVVTRAGHLATVYAQAMLHIAERQIVCSNLRGLGMGRSTGELRNRIAEILGPPAASPRQTAVARWIGLILTIVALTSPLALRAASQSADRDSVDVALDEHAAKALKYLVARQRPDGSIGPPAPAVGPAASRIAISSLCGLAWLYSGSSPGEGAYGAPLGKVVEYLRSRQQASGVIADQGTSAGTYQHAYATLFLAKAHQASAGKAFDKKLLEAAVKVIVDAQGDDGAWRYVFVKQPEGDLSVTVCELLALAAAAEAGIEVPRALWLKSTQYVLGCQSDDGGFSYQLKTKGSSGFARSAKAAVTLHALGQTGSDAEKRALDYLKLAAQQRPVVLEQYMDFYETYYAAHAMWYAGENDWKTWFATMRPQLLSKQRDDGSWPNSDLGPEFTTALAAVVLQIPYFKPSPPKPFPAG